MIGNQTSGKPVIGSGKESFVRFSTNELSGNNEHQFSARQTALQVAYRLNHSNMSDAVHPIKYLPHPHPDVECLLWVERYR